MANTLDLAFRWVSIPAARRPDCELSLDIIEQTEAELPFFMNECLHFTLEAGRALEGKKVTGSIKPLRAVLRRIRTARDAVGVYSLTGDRIERLQDLDLNLAELERDLKRALETLLQHQAAGRRRKVRLK